MTLRGHSSDRGQAMVEFAMILLLLLFIIFVLIEAARLFQANLTVQRAAREAGRYAITGQFETDCLLEDPPCADPQVISVQHIAEAGLAGLRLNPDADARLREPNAYLIQVLTPAPDGGQWIEGVGNAGAPVMVRVLYELDIITPLLRPIAEVVRVTGQVVMNNEQANQIGGTSGDPSAPNLPPPPTVPPPPPPPDVELTMAGPALAITDSEYSYTLVVRNNSNELAATGVTLVDTLPADVVFVSAPGCPESGGVVTCEIGTLEPMEHVSFIITVRASDQDGLTVTNEAEVTLDQADPIPGNNNASLNTTFDEDPNQTDVEIVKTGPDIVQGGETFTYHLLVGNISTVAAEGVEVVDTLPGGVTLVDAPAICHLSGDTVRCTVGSLAAGSYVGITLSVTAPDVMGTITNTASVTVTDPPEFTTDNNSASWPTEVVVLPDLQVTLIDTPDPVLVGGDLTYEIIVTNNGDGNATNVVLTDILPASVNFISVSPPDNCTRAGNTVSCNLGNLPSGASTTRMILVRPAESGTIVNTAYAYGYEDDRNAGDNTASVVTSVEASADLAITKTGPDGEVEQGDQFSYTLTVRNLGPSAATGVTVRDTLPAGLSAVSATTTQGYCDIQASPIVCSLGRMDNGAVATIILRVMPLDAGTFRNVASVTGGEDDPDTTNNSSQATTVVAAGNYFMTAAPLCGEVGTRVTLNGYNWRAGRTVDLSFNGQPFPAPAVTADGDGRWTRTYDIPGPLADGVYNFTASQPGRTYSVPFTIPCPAPNLIISQPAFVGSPPSTPGVRTTIRVNIQNIGNLDAVSQFFVGLYVNPDPEPVADSTHLPAAQRTALVAVNGLLVGQTKTIDFVLESGLNSGTNRIFSVVDSDPGPTGNIQERTETDNISTVLQAVIDGSSATPTPTPVPANPGSVTGRVRNEAGNPQANVEIRLYHGSDNSLESIGFSDFNGTYFFASVAADSYNMMACIRIENTGAPGTFSDYWASVPGVVVTAGQTTTQNLFLQLVPERCRWP